MFKRLIPLSIAILCMGAVAVRAVAKDAPTKIKILGGTEGTSETVRFGDLDINSPSGAKVLLGRITVAATRLCDAGGRDLRKNTAKAPCIRAIVDKTVAAIDSPALTGLNESGHKTST